MKTKTFFLLFLTLSTTAIQASDEASCTRIDMRNEYLGKNRDQQKINWCYAFTAADMLASDQKIATPISAADIAITYNDSSIGRSSRWLDVNVLNRNNTILNQLPHQTGFIKFSLNSYFEQGHCPEAVMPSEKWTKVTRTNTGWKTESLPLYESMLAIYKLHQQRNKLTVDNLPYYFSFKNIDAVTFLKILKTNDMTDFYTNLSQTACKNDRVKFHHKIAPTMTVKHSYIFDDIDQVLEAGRLVSMDFDYALLENRNNSRVNPGNLHTANIVGRRWSQSSKSCQYLIRDSYGSQCNDYDPSYTCEKGNVWIDSSIIYKGMTSIVYL